MMPVGADWPDKGLLVTRIVPSGSVLAALTTWPPDNVPELPRKLLSPAYDAVMVCVPTDKAEVLKLAVVVPPVVLNVP
jgi:hypothetical protein